MVRGPCREAHIAATEPDVAESVSRDAAVQGDQRDTSQPIIKVVMCGVGDGKVNFAT